ncbi:hypothetical protein Acsp01_86040 [Actinoplanes sp. NBRC 101535]|nr:hypothetical protein Acsp01_86040 [Actinoplanes sp. NBRC 101535]
MPGHLLTRLAATTSLYCTATWTAMLGDRRRCHRPVDADGVHPGDHTTADPLDPATPEQWSTIVLTRAAYHLPQQPRQRGVILLDESTLADLLRLPPGQRIIGFEPRFLTLAIAVHLEGEGLPETVEGSEPRQVGGAWFQPRPAVVNRDAPADVQHQAVLAALDQPGRLESSISTAARRRTLERHAPRTSGRFICCPICTSSPYYTGPVRWPCPDYYDAAAPLAEGLACPST